MPLACPYAMVCLDHLCNFQKVSRDVDVAVAVAVAVDVDAVAVAVAVVVVLHGGCLPLN